jgi:hypothetical protein
MGVHRGLSDSFLYCDLCTFMAQDDVKDRVVHETRRYYSGVHFLVFLFKKNPLLLQEKQEF